MLLPTSSLRLIHRLLIPILLMGFLLTSCSPKTPLSQTQESTTSVLATPPHPLPAAIATQKPAVQVAPALLPTEAIAPTAVATGTPPKIDADLRLSYVTYEQDDRNEIIDSQLWVQYSPDQSPQLLYRTGNGNPNHIISSIFWSHDNRWAAFAHLVGDESHVAFSVFDTQAEDVSQVTRTFSVDHPFAICYLVDWSLDDQWLYLEYEDIEQFLHTQIVNIATQASYPLDHLTQDKLTAWSPVVADEYAYISRKSFPNPGGDVLCIGKAGLNKPLRCTEKFDSDNFLIRNSFSWSLDGEKALVAAGNNSQSTRYFLLDLNSMQWETTLTLTEAYFELSKYWSPDNQFIVFYFFQSGLHVLDVSRESPALIPVSDFKRVIPLGWLSDSRAMIFQADYAVYAVNPGEASEVRLVEDFTPVLENGPLFFQIDLLKG